MMNKRLIYFFIYQIQDVIYIVVGKEDTRTPLT